jgi:hypothetical protein
VYFTNKEQAELSRPCFRKLPHMCFKPGISLLHEDVIYFAKAVCLQFAADGIAYNKSLCTPKAFSEWMFIGSGGDVVTRPDILIHIHEWFD